DHREAFRLAEISARKIATRKVGPLEIGASEVGVRQVNVGEILVREIQASKTDSAQILKGLGRSRLPAFHENGVSVLLHRRGGIQEKGLTHPAGSAWPTGRKLILS